MDTFIWMEILAWMTDKNLYSEKMKIENENFLLEDKNLFYLDQICKPYTTKY